MDTNRQGFLNFFSTSRTYLASSTGVNLNYFPISIFSFIGKKLKEHTPATIRYRLTQVSILNHVFYLQIFNIYRLKSIYILVRGFVEEIFSLISHFFVSPSNQYPCFIPTSRAFFSSRKLSIPASKLLFRINQVLRIYHLIAFAINTKRFNTYINSYFFISLRKLFDGNIIARKSHRAAHRGLRGLRLRQRRLCGALGRPRLVAHARPSRRPLQRAPALSHLRPSPGLDTALHSSARASALTEIGRARRLVGDQLRARENRWA